MAERSTPRAEHAAGLGRGRLIVGLLLLGAVAASVSFGASRLRTAPDPGTLVYAARQGVYERELATGDDRRVAELEDSVEVAMPSPDGRYVAYGHGQGELWLLDVQAGTRFRVARRFTIPLGWSPDGRLIAGEVLSDGDLVAVDPGGGRTILLSGGYATGSVPVWIDRDRFAITRDERSFSIVDDGDRIHSEEGIPLVASADGAQLMWVRGGAVWVADVERRGLGEPMRVLDEEATFAAASRQGHVAIATSDGVHVVEAERRTRRVVDRGVDWLGWARAGAVLLYAHDGAAYALELAEPDAEPKRVTREGADVLPLLAFSVVGGR